MGNEFDPLKLPSFETTRRAAEEIQGMSEAYLDELEEDRIEAALAIMTEAHTSYLNAKSHERKTLRSYYFIGLALTIAIAVSLVAAVNKWGNHQLWGEVAAGLIAGFVIAVFQAVLEIHREAVDDRRIAVARMYQLNMEDQLDEKKPKKRRRPTLFGS